MGGVVVGGGVRSAFSAKSGPGARSLRDSPSAAARRKRLFILRIFGRPRTRGINTYRRSVAAAGGAALRRACGGTGATASPSEGRDSWLIARDRERLWSSSAAELLTPLTRAPLSPSVRLKLDATGIKGSDDLRRWIGCLFEAGSPGNGRSLPLLCRGLTASRRPVISG